MKQTLLVSDDQHHLELTAEILESMGWETHVATTTELVSKICKTHPPSLIVADIEMKGGRGFESIAVARNALPASFIVAVTRSNNKDLWEKVAAVCGANEYVVGPVSAPKLSAAIDNGIAAGIVEGWLSSATRISRTRCSSVHGLSKLVTTRISMAANTA